jgi:hypothetical protein
MEFNQDSSMILLAVKIFYKIMILMQAFWNRIWVEECGFGTEKIQ